MRGRGGRGGRGGGRGGKNKSPKLRTKSVVSENGDSAGGDTTTVSYGTVGSDFQSAGTATTASS